MSPFEKMNNVPVVVYLKTDIVEVSVVYGPMSPEEAADFIGHYNSIIPDDLCDKMKWIAVPIVPVSMTNTPTQNR